MSRIDDMVEKAISIAEDDSHGYSQLPPSGRWGPDYDCSSLMYEIADYAGYPVGTGRGYTGTMAKDFKEAGFDIIPFLELGLDNLKVGDILLNLALHAEVYIGDGMLVGAQGSEDGGYSGQAGDQTGREIVSQPVYIYKGGWDYVLRPPSDDEETDETLEEEALEEPDISEGGEEMPSYPYGNNGAVNQGWQGRGYQGGQQYPQQNGGWPQQQPQQWGNNGGWPQGGYGLTPQGQYGYSQPGMTLTRVNGIEGARQYPVAPNSTVPLFDGNEDYMYVKSADGEGFPNIRTFKIEEVENAYPQHHWQEESMPGMNGDMVSRKEFEELKEMIHDVKQSISGAAESNSRSNGQSETKQSSGRNSRNS